MECKRRFFGVIRSTGEQVVVEDWREIIDTTTQHNTVFRSVALGGRPYCRTTDGREVRCVDAEYVNVEQLQGTWEILGQGDWIPLDVSPLHQS